METKLLTCVVCPRGCALEADVADGKLLAVRGNACKRGAAYAESELFHAERLLTSTVTVAGRTTMLPVRTRTPVPRATLTACMEEIRQITALPPVAIGAVIRENLAGTGVDLIASAPQP